MPERTLQPYYPELARLGTEAYLEEGAVLWREGDPGDSVALLLAGTLEVVHETAQGEVVVARAMESA